MFQNSTFQDIRDINVRAMTRSISWEQRQVNSSSVDLYFHTYILHKQNISRNVKPDKNLSFPSVDLLSTATPCFSQLQEAIPLTNLQICADSFLMDSNM